MLYNTKAIISGGSTHIICFFLMCLIQIMSPQYLLADFEKPSALKAQSFLEPQFLKGEHYTVNEEVKNDGLLNHYTVKSSYGDFKVSSTSSLQLLVGEIKAIAEMKKIETNDTAIESLKQSGKNTVAGLENMVKDPKGTFESAAAGVGGLFNRAKGTVGKREATEAEDNKMAQLLGFSKSKGKIATQFGVNMYSRNEVLQTELDRLAWADYLGGLGVGMATSVVPGVGGVLLTTSGTARLLNEAINTTPASELWLQNKNKLLGMGMNEDTIELFLNNPHFSPALLTVMVTALDSLKGVDNRELYLKVALQAGTPDMAKIITESAILTAGYHKHIAPLKHLVPIARLARAEKDDGTIVVALPGDHIIWSEMVADITISLVKKAQNSKGTGLEIWIPGDFSVMARGRLEEMGWEVHTQSRNQLIPAQE
ncbi:MAG: hypothetical protein ACI8PB_004893 [Desulforhopalus sp.]|jgi:hypothetical protein